MGHVGGKLLLFQAGLPTLGVGRLKPSRDNLHLYNSEREPSLRNPEDPFFKRYAGEASSRQITLDVFLGTSGFADLASLASIPRYTCGQVRVFKTLSCVHRYWCRCRVDPGLGMVHTRRLPLPKQQCMPCSTLMFIVRRRWLLLPLQVSWVCKFSPWCLHARCQLVYAEGIHVVC
jgi:hypothetical protein